VLTVPSANSAPFRGAFCSKASSAGEGRYIKEENFCKEQTFKGKNKSCQKERKEEVTNIIKLSQEFSLG